MGCQMRPVGEKVFRVRLSLSILSYSLLGIHECSVRQEEKISTLLVQLKETVKENEGSSE